MVCRWVGSVTHQQKSLKPLPRPPLQPGTLLAGRKYHWNPPTAQLLPCMTILPSPWLKLASFSAAIASMSPLSSQKFLLLCHHFQIHLTLKPVLVWQASKARGYGEESMVLNTWIVPFSQPSTGASMYATEIERRHFRYTFEVWSVSDTQKFSRSGFCANKACLQRLSKSAKTWFGLFAGLLGVRLNETGTFYASTYLEQEILMLHEKRRMTTGFLFLCCFFVWQWVSLFVLQDHLTPWGWKCWWTCLGDLGLEAPPFLPDQTVTTLSFSLVPSDSWVAVSSP